MVVDPWVRWRISGSARYDGAVGASLPLTRPESIESSLASLLPCSSFVDGPRLINETPRPGLCSGRIGGYRGAVA